jgi:hypothetical protein
VIDAWSLYDNGQHVPVLLAYGTPDEITVAADAAFQKIVADFNLRL